MGREAERADHSTFSAWLRDLAHFSDEPPSGASPPLAVGERLSDRFVIRRLVGRGGMGFVYEAFDEHLGAPCALKTLGAVDPERVVMLKHEFRTLAGLHHPNLISPGELHQDGGRTFFTMELVGGVEPGAWVAGDEGRAKHLLAALADVLGAMHGRGVVHRDIKPSNVVVAPDGRVVLLDFGLARDSARPLWFDRGRAGTSLYMAPELGGGEPADASTDWYAVGVLLYEVLAGAAPFSGVGESLRAQKLEGAPPAREARPDLSQDLSRLIDELLDPDPARRPDARRVLARLNAASAPATAAPEPKRPALVGRRLELARLRAAFERVRDGKPAAVLVSGLSGIGKTALVGAFLAEIGERAEVLAGRCRARESVPFQALDGAVEALAAALARESAETRRELVPAEALALGWMFPVLGALDVFSQRGERPAESEVREEAAPALRALLSSLAARRPVVVFLDDLQWADDDGLTLLARALAPPIPAGILLVAASRTPHRPPPLEPITTWVTVAVEPLSSDHTEMLARALFHEEPHSDALARIVRDTQGHPLYVQELTRLESRAPGARAQGLDEVICGRADALDDDGRMLLDLVVVAGAPTPRRILARASGVSPGELLTRLRALEGHDFVRAIDAAGDLFDTLHDRVREAISARLSADAVARGHRRLAEAFEAELPDRRARLAIHWAGAGEAAEAYRHATAAADEAIRAAAFAHAAELYGTALASVRDPRDRADLRERRARALALAWRPLEAAEAFLQAAASATGDRRRELRLRAVEQLLVGGDLRRGLAEIAGAVGEAGAFVPRSTPAALGIVLARRAQLRLARRGWLPARARPSGSEEVVSVLLAASSTLAMLDSLIALGYHTRALLVAHELGDPSRLVHCLSLEACIQAGAGSVVEAERLVAQGRAILDRHPSPIAESIWRSGCLVLAVQQGRWREGLEVTAHDPSRQIGRTAWQHASRGIYEATCEFNLGHFLELQERCERARKEADERSDRFLELAFGVSFHPLDALMQGRVGEARRTLHRAEALLWKGGRGGYLHALHLVSTLFVELYDDRPRAALEVAKGPARSLARRSHYGRIYLTFLGATAALGALRGGSSRSLARAASQRARALRRDPVPWAPAYGELVAAQIAHLAGRRRERDSCLARARSGFAEHGSEHMVEVVDGAAAGLRDRGVLCPERFAAMLAPALW